MVVTSKLSKRTAAEKILQRKRIAQDKARARHWVERRRKENDSRAILPTAETTVIAIAVPSQDSQENSRVLQDLLTRRSALLLKLSELDIVIKVIQHTYN